MPTADRSDHEAAHERDRDKSKSKSSAKTKDLSHVPCKFFKVGSCTAGSSCPFSHNVLEPGQPKDVCTWFIKGNCKFGHKCALAHVLPGQAMSMDRRNKKAAQVANAASPSTKDSKDGKDASRSKGKSSADRRNDRANNPLLSGSTAPTRMLQGSSSSRAPMPIALKATISPSVPAPPLQDSDFTALGMPDEATKLPSAPATRKPAPAGVTEDSADSLSGIGAQKSSEIPARSSPSPLPASIPSQPVRINDTVTSADLGPIGSPRSNSSRELAGFSNGFSPGTSPSKGTGFLSTSPFSAPGTQAVFFSEQSDFSSRSGLAASLGATHTWAEHGRLPPGGAKEGAGDSVVVESEELEEFIPGSLSDLLTPEERFRRNSRTNVPHTAAALGPGMASPRDGGWGAGTRPSVESHHHRYSRSVPAPTLLGDIKSIWSDNGQSPVPVGSPRSSTMERTVTTAPIPGFNSGTPGSFKSASGFGPRSLMDDQISTFLSPSNASAAFLPGTAQHYLGARNIQRANSNSSNSSGGGGGLRTGTYTAGPGANAANLLARLNEPIQPHTAGYTRTQFDGTSESYGGQPFQLGGRPVQHTEAEDRHGMSPSALALHQHAPGQSLPQGLAAGYSRIHALPPPPVIPSPSASSVLVGSQGGFASGTSFQQSITGQAAFSDWAGLSPSKANMHDTVRTGLFFDPSQQRVSYSTATAGSMRPSGATPPAMRTPSGKGWVPPTSPLSRPTLDGDDEDLFVLDH